MDPSLNTLKDELDGDLKEVDIRTIERDARGRISLGAEMHSFEFAKTHLQVDHIRFLGRLYRKVLKGDSSLVVNLIGKADRKNRSGDDSVNIRISSQRADSAANRLRALFAMDGLDSQGRINTLGLGDLDAVNRGDATQAENARQRAVQVFVTPRKR